MKLFALLLLVAVVGKVAAYPRQSPYSNRPVLYRMAEESEEDDEPQDDNNNESSEEWVNDDNPPAFSDVFPSVPSSQTKSPHPGAFLEVQKDIEKTGWKNPQKNHKRKMQVDRLRSNVIEELNPRWRLFRDDTEAEDDDESVEDEEENEEAEARGFRSGPPNRMPVSYAPRQPFYTPARLPMRNAYSYAPRRQMNYPRAYPQSVMPSYNYNRPPVNYGQRRQQPVSMYDRRQFYQVPVRVSLPVRRFSQSPVMRSPLPQQPYYRRPVAAYRRQRQYPRYRYNHY